MTSIRYLENGTASEEASDSHTSFVAENVKLIFYP